MSNWQLELRHLALFAIAMTMCACASIGHIKVPSEQVRLQARPSKSPRVLIIAIDGLRTDTVARYLRVIRDSDYEPNWNSGLARLALDGFKFARSNRTETTVPSTDMAALASLATGATVGQHGIVGRNFLKTMADGTRVEYDFRNPLHAGGIWYTALGDAPTRQNAPLATTLLNDEPWWSALGQFVRIGITFFPFGQPAEWHIPSWRTAAVLAAIPHPSGALAIPLLDQAAQVSARQQLLAGHDVVIARFRGVEGASCFQKNARCLESAGDLAKQQDRAFRKIDEEMARLIRHLRMDDDVAYQNTTVIVVGLNGSDERPTSEDVPKQVSYTPDWVLKQLQTKSTEDACAQWFESAQREGRIALTTDGGFLQIYLPHLRPGQTAESRFGRSCLIRAARALVDEPSASWLSAIAWKAPDEGKNGYVNKASTRARLNSTFAASLPNHRRARILGKIHALWPKSGPSNTGDLILFAAPKMTFIARSESMNDLYTTHGNLSTSAMSVPFLIASRHLADDVASQLLTTAVDIQDLGPTVSQILGSPSSNLDAKFTRPAVFRWRLGKAPKLEVMRANRQAPPAIGELGPTIVWSESPSRFSLSLQEAQSNWPPDRVTLSLGADLFTYNPDADGFPEGSPCRFIEANAVRRWQCDYAIDHSSPKLLRASVKRIPHPTEDGNWEESFAVYLGQSNLQIQQANVVCADADAVKLRVKAQSEMPFSLIRLFMQPIGRVQRIPLGTQVALYRFPTHRQCDAATTSENCRDFMGTKSLDQTVTLPYSYAQYEHFKWASTLYPRPRMTTSEDGVPRAQLGFLVAEFCTVEGQCESRDILSDTTYTDAVGRGCSAP